MLDSFFKYYGYTTDASVNIFLLQFGRMELFKTVRWLRSKYGNEIVPAELYRYLCLAVGSYQGEKMAKHVCVDRFSGVATPLSKLVEFYFSYEAMIVRDAVEGGVLATFDVEKNLLAAVQEGATEQVKALLGHPKANPNMTDDSNSPLLHTAFQNYFDGVVQALLAAKANPDVLSQDGKTLLMTVVEDGDADSVQKLIEAGVSTVSY